MKTYFTSLVLLFALSLHAQLPETDIFLCTIKSKEGKYSFSKPTNITNRKGYDNQPCFTKDNKKILFVSVRDTTQSDIFSYDLLTKKTQQVTKTKISEYSPAYTPDKKYISVVRVDADSGQRFYQLPEKDFSKEELIKNTDSIGYACWLNDSTIAMFILGHSNTLQLLNRKTSVRKLIASDIGRCMKLSPDGKRMYFVIKANEEEWFIYSMDCTTYELTRIVKTMKGSEDFAIFPDGSLVMGFESKLYQFNKSGAWTMIADFSSELSGFYRIAINDKGNLMALVAYTGTKP
jgi:Tol biopolymer transport system component